MFAASVLEKLPADVVPVDEQLEDIQDLFNGAKGTLEKALRIDGGISKEKFFIYVKEDKNSYLTIPSNSSELISIPGWDALFSLLMELGVRLKMSNTKYENPGSSEETRKYFAGLANRVSKSDWSDDDKLIVSGTQAAERGRATVDIYALKKTSSIMNLEKYLPESSRIGKTTYMRFYLSQLSGPNSVDTLKAIPDLVNKIMSNWVEAHQAALEGVAGRTVLSVGQVVGDLTRKRTVKRKVEGKTIDAHIPIHAVRLSESPFLITEEEVAHAKTLEGPWDALVKFNNKYSKGVPVTEIESARENYSKNYDAQMRFAQATGSMKSRRLEAFKELASFSMNNKEMKEFKLTKKTKEIALENFVEIIKSYNPDDDSVAADVPKILVNIRPTMTGFNSNNWNYINKENILRLYGFKRASQSGAKWLKLHGSKIHEELVNYFPTMINLTPEFEAEASESEDSKNEE
jgi:hypothetical protein